VCHPRVFASGLKIADAFFRYTGAGGRHRWPVLIPIPASDIPFPLMESPFKDHVVLQARSAYECTPTGLPACARTHGQYIPGARARARAAEGGERGI